ncbi:MAG: NIPSNAP family protein [Chloroflexi bacterium]|nr:NIPSNAP family protein [Chloroflexota bacterium]
MLYELRSYWVEPSLLQAYLAWANDRALPVLQGEFGFRVLGFWSVADATGTVEDDPPNVVWIIAWRDRAEREAGWETATRSSAWLAAREGIPKFHRKPGNFKFLTAIPRSPLQ